MDKNPISRPISTGADAFIAALQWWQEAGVDSDFTDEPRNWLEKPAAPAQEAQAAAAAPVAPPEPVIPPIGGPREEWPQDLAAFGEWWTSLADLPGSGPALAPRGAANADLMILAMMPGAEDRDTLLAGRQGELLANMLRAMGIEADKAYFATALPRHAGHPDWADLARRGLGDIVLHHVRLAAPGRVLMLGREMLPLFGHDPAQGTANALEIALEGTGVPALASFDVETLLQQPRFRKNLWQGWLQWTEGSQ